MRPDSEFEIEASWSKAGIGTCIVLKNGGRTSNGTNCKKGTNKGVLRIAMDLGCTPIIDKAARASVVCISHGHIDHIGAIFGHARSHALEFCSVPTYFVPFELAPILERALICFSELDGKNRDDREGEGAGTRSGNEKKHETKIIGELNGRKSLLKMNIVPIHPGQEYEIPRQKKNDEIRFFIRAYPTTHGNTPSLGYVLFSETKTTTLKEEYRLMTGKELGKLAKGGAKISDVIFTCRVEVFYTGDTSADGLLLKSRSHPISQSKPLSEFRIESELERNAQYESQHLLYQALSAPLVICELTYVDPALQELAKERGHMDISGVISIFGNLRISRNSDKKIDNGGRHTGLQQRLVFFHVSGRHAPAVKILESICQVLPQDILKDSEVCISSFLTCVDEGDDDKTGLKECAWRKHVKRNGCIKLEDFLFTKIKS